MSRWAGTCQLVAQTTERDRYGAAKTKDVRRSVPCNVYSMGDAAYFAACAAGIHPQAVLQVRSACYAGERLVEFDGRVLSVERVDRSSPDFVRLTLAEKTGERPNG